MHDTAPLSPLHRRSRLVRLARSLGISLVPAFVLVVTGSQAIAQTGESPWSTTIGARVGGSYTSLRVAPDLSGLGGAADAGGMASMIPVERLDGVGAGVGASAQLWYRGFVGVEADLLFVFTSASGDGSFSTPAGEQDLTVELETTELLLPVLALARTELGPVSVHFGLGLTLAQQLSADVTSSPEIGLVAGDPQTDVLATLSVGAAVPVGGTAIPVELRFMTQPDPESVEDRLMSDGTEVTLDPSWTGVGWLLIGYDFEG